MSSAAPLQAQAAKPRPLSNSTHAGLLLQRKCACGSPTSSLSGKCAECAVKKRVQTKLAVGASNDPLGQEAGRITDSPTYPKAPPTSTHSLLTCNSGSSIDQSTRTFMESRFGYDFSDVRIHTDERAAKSARGMGAQAYTEERHIVFGEGQFTPGTVEGKALLAHELAHVVQQGQSKGISSTPAAAETEADHAATQAVMGQSVTISAGVPAGVQCKPLREEEIDFEISEINKKIAKIEAKVEGVSLPAVEEQRLFEERNRLLEERADLQAQLGALTSEDPRLQEAGERRNTLRKLRTRLDEPRSYPGRETDQTDSEAIEPIVQEEDRKKQDLDRRWGKYVQYQMEGLPSNDKKRNYKLFMTKKEFFEQLDKNPGWRRSYWKAVEDQAPPPDFHTRGHSDVGEVAGRYISAHTPQEYERKKNTAELGQLYDNLFAAPIEIATGVVIAAPTAAGILETGVVVSETVAAAALEVHVTVAVYGVSLTAAQQLARSAYTFYLRNAIGINEAIIQGTEITIDLLGGDTGPISPGDGLNFADDAVAAAGKRTYRAVEAEVIPNVDEALDVVRIKVRSVHEIDAKSYANDFDSGKQIHIRPKQDPVDTPSKETQVAFDIPPQTSVQSMAPQSTKPMRRPPGGGPRSTTVATGKTITSSNPSRYEVTTLPRRSEPLSDSNIIPNETRVIKPVRSSADPAVTGTPRSSAGDGHTARDAARSYLDEFRAKKPLRGSFGEGWDHKRFPEGPKRVWKPRDPPDMPTLQGKHPTWDTVRSRVWKNLAHNEIELRKSGKAVRDTESLLDLDPVKSLTDKELGEMLLTGKGRPGFEIEHARIPQRASRMFEEAGLSGDEAKRLAHLGDPQNLDPVPQEWHAVVDEAAAKWKGRNPTLPKSIDDRLANPLGSMRNSEVQDLLDAIAAHKLDLKRTVGGRRLRAALQAENERRGGKWVIP